MATGTTVKIFAPRIHKSNAADTLESATEEFNHHRSKLMALAVATPPGDLDSIDLIMDDVYERIDAMEQAWFQQMIARRIVDDPEDCEDELEGLNAPHDGRCPRRTVDWMVGNYGGEQ
jgi:hypothetical protein